MKINNKNKIKQYISLKKKKRNYKRNNIIIFKIENNNDISYNKLKNKLKNNNIILNNTMLVNLIKKEQYTINSIYSVL